MEKIYMNNNQNKEKSTFQQIFKSQLSKKLSIVMVLVSFFSFLMIGVTNVSYAAVTPIPEDEGLGDSFTTAAVGTEVFGRGTATFPVFMYSTTNGYPIFCLERDIAFVAGTELTKEEEPITDSGLLYIMANTFPHKYFKDASDQNFPDEVQTWLTQATIWQYLYETGVENNTGTDSSNTSTNIAAIQTVTSIEWLNEDHTATEGTCYVKGCDADDISTATFYETKIAPLVAKAKQADVSANGTLTMSIANQEISVTDDEKYYQTSLVTVSGPERDNFVNESLSVTIDSAPDGTILVDQNGQVIENATGVTSFYVRVPVDSVTEDNKVIRLSATGTFRGYSGYYYRGTDAQTVSSVFTTDVPNTTGLEIPINYTPEVPDTGMNLAQSIYFIGLVVLLCGVGIIYANAKPKAKQQ